ncbi:hypothetical protein [Dysgonomonas termitidis]|uniref:Lipoprotein n=1 Tax=Dysgonomonas termitidis TaxID=1516126 RepID=A0ABV9KQH7_9BACT
MKDYPKAKAKALFILIPVFVLSACRTRTLYIPVESVRTEYRDRLLRDSVHLYDSVFMKMKGDTVWLEKYKYLYRDRLLRDSVFVNDTIRVPYPVEVEKEINRMSSFQSFQVWCGRILLLLIIGWSGVWWWKKRI